MEYLLALIVISTFVFVAFFLVLYFSNFMSHNVKVKINKHAKRESEQIANKNKLLGAISTIHSAKNSNALNNALKDFYQSIRYHQTHNINFLDKNLDKLNISVIKFAKYKSFKLYGLDLKHQASRDYLMYLKKNSLNAH